MVHRLELLALICAVSACKSNSPTPQSEASSKSDSDTSGTPAVEREEPTEPPPRDGPTIEIANETGACQRTLCIAGPGELDSEPNIDLGDLCRKSPGAVRRCEDEHCRSAWKQDDWQAGLDALIMSIDRDGNGKVDDDDPACAINMVGWSTGAGIIAGPLVAALVADSRMTPERAKVERMVLVAPRPAGGAPTLKIPEVVRNAWIYRNTVAPADDCSRTWESGPWISPEPECGPQTQCWDYDYSYEPKLAFVSRRGARSGEAIGHCNMMAVVAKVAPDNLERGREAMAEHLPRFSDGRPSGRPHDRHDRR